MALQLHSHLWKPLDPVRMDSTKIIVLMKPMGEVAEVGVAVKLPSHLWKQLDPAHMKYSPDGNVPFRIPYSEKIWQALNLVISAKHHTFYFGKF